MRLTGAGVLELLQAEVFHKKGEYLIKPANTLLFECYSSDALSDFARFSFENTLKVLDTFPHKSGHHVVRVSMVPVAHRCSFLNLSHMITWTRGTD